MEMTKKLRLLLFLTIFSIVGFTACDLNDSRQTGTLEVRMTDAPGDYDAVWIDVQSIQVHKSDPADTGGEGEETGEAAEDAGWITVTDDPARIDLLTLRNGNEITLGETELEAGTYTQLRLMLGNENEVVVDGETNALTTPGQQQSGTKLNINATIEEGRTYTLLVDFDAGRSIVETGNGMYILKPVLRAVNLSETGTITGSVSPADIQTGIMAVAGEDTLSTLTDSNGEFTIVGAAPGSYTVEYSPNSDQYRDSTLTGVEVDAGETTSLETVALEQQSAG